MTDLTKLAQEFIENARAARDNYCSLHTYATNSTCVCFRVRQIKEQHIEFAFNHSQELAEGFLALQAENEALKSDFKNTKRIVAEKEIKRLEKLVKEKTEYAKKASAREQKLAFESYAVVSENERLRKALEYQYEVALAWSLQPFGAPGSDIAFLELRDFARAALKPQGKGS